MNLEENFGEKKYTPEKILNDRALQAFEIKSFSESNHLMAEIVKDALGGEATISLAIKDQEQKEKLKSIFYEAALTATQAFQDSFNQEGDYDLSKESAYWAACDQEGPIAKSFIVRAAQVINIDTNQQHISEVTNNVTFEDATRLAIRTLLTYGIINEQSAKKIESTIIELCREPQKVRDMLARVIPPTDHYYQRIRMEEKKNDESILKFNNGNPHADEDLKIINLSLRLANATWLAAQRHAAKKDGHTDRIDPSKRSGVFNTPDRRQLQQFFQCKTQKMNDIESVLRIAFELTKDSWMIED